MRDAEREGIPIVLVHGLSASSRWWRAVLPLLGDRRTLLVDIPHYGRTFPPTGTVDWLAARVEDAAPVDLVGHSLGGLACARLAAARPQLVRRLVLAAPVGAPREEHLLLARSAAALARTAATAPRALLQAMAADALRWGPQALLRGSLFAASQTFAGAIAAPTLLVWGARDRLVPVELGEAWRRLIPDARLEVIAGAGHAPMIEAPSAFAKLLLEFLDDRGDGLGVRPVDGVPRAGDDDEPAAGRG